MSGVGKGVTAASIGNILQSRGLEVTNVKIDPYVNVDAGTMNPTEHGEVFVLDDGTECDQDLGNYERFLNRDLSGANYMTTGSVYLSVINRERSLGYGGRCVEVVPHIPLEVISRINKAAKKDKADIVIIEIGGTVGEYQNILFLEAVRMLGLNNLGNVLLILVSYLPIRGRDNELKTKPTQYAVRTLNAAGLSPDIVIARANTPLDKKRKEKISQGTGMGTKEVISTPEFKSIYEIPMNFEKNKLDELILEKLGLKAKKKGVGEFARLVKTIESVKKPVKIGIVGKYFSTGKFVIADSYISVIEAIKHASYAHKREPVIEWIDSEKLGNLSEYDGIIVPGGFGSRGVDGKLEAINFARRKKIPFLGLCYGMQMAVVEYARNVARLKDANTTEIDPVTPHPVINILTEQKELLKEDNYGGTMRLGAYPAVLKKGTIAREAYGKTRVSERHRHRYEVNPEYIDKLEKKGVIFSGVSPDKVLMEIMELPKSEHPFFVGTQFHPELKSRPLDPHPLFLKFIKAAL